MTFWLSRLTKANDEKEMRLLPWLCDPQKLSLDIGAKVGMYTYHLRCFSKQVCAFEPIPELAQLLRKSFKKKVIVEQVALSNQAGPVTMRIPFDRKAFPKYGRSTIEGHNHLDFIGKGFCKTISVKTKKLDDFNFDEIGFIKIDVEGHELAVLEGAERTLQRSKPCLLIEASQHHFPGAVERLKTFLEARGYLGFFIFNQSLCEMREFDLDKQGELVENFIFIPAFDNDRIKKIREKSHNI